MPLNVEIRPGSRELRPLQDWEKRLSIPARTLLHHASEEKLKLFVRPPPTEFAYAIFRVHESASPLTKGPLIPVSKSELVGFVPDAATLAAFISGQPVEVESFDTLICNNLSWDSFRGLIPNTVGHTFQPTGWKAGAFGIAESPAEETHESDILPGQADCYDVTQRKFAVRPDHVCIRDADVRVFLSSMLSYSFISDLHTDGAFSEELPSYISGKLKEVIEANRALWRTREGGLEDRHRTRAATRKYLSEDFGSLCKKGSSKKGLLELAVTVCDPSMPGSNVPGTSATREMLALATAAKLFWSPAYVELGTPWTHPAREEVTKFLQFMGMTTTNMASTGATLIRPETASGNASSERPPLFRPPLSRTMRRLPFG